MAYILHIDTSGATGLVMIAENGQQLVVKYNETERDHAGALNSMMDAALAEAGISLGQLHAVAVCSGPGSYTGLRIGMATAKGLCYALDIPLMLHNKLELLTDKRTAPDRYITLLPARKGEYFILRTEKGGPEQQPVHMIIDEINEIIRNENNIKYFGLITDDIFLKEGDILYANDCVVTGYWAHAAYEKYKQEKFENIATVEPLYVKSVFIHKKI